MVDRVDVLSGNDMEVNGQSLLVGVDEAIEYISGRNDVVGWQIMPYLGRVDMLSADPDMAIKEINSAHTAKIAGKEGVLLSTIRVGGQVYGGILLSETAGVLAPDLNSIGTWYRAERVESVESIVGSGMLVLPRRSIQFPRMEDNLSWYDGGRVALAWDYLPGELSQSMATNASGLSWNWLNNSAPDNFADIQVSNDVVMQWASRLGFLARVPSSRINKQKTVEANRKLLQMGAIDTSQFDLIDRLTGTR